MKETSPLGPPWETLIHALRERAGGRPFEAWRTFSPPGYRFRLDRDPTHVQGVTEADFLADPTGTLAAAIRWVEQTPSAASSLHSLASPGKRLVDALLARRRGRTLTYSWTPVSGGIWIFRVDDDPAQVYRVAERDLITGERAAIAAAVAWLEGLPDRTGER